MLAVLLSPHGSLFQPRACLGKRALLVTSHEASQSLAVADELLSSGASVELLVPLPRSGLASRSDPALRLMQRIQRQGFRDLMVDLEYSVGVGGVSVVGAGNRPRVSWSHVRADDVEALALALADSDLVLFAPSGAALDDPSEESARFSMRRTLLSGMLALICTRSGVRIERGSTVPRLRWAWLPKPGG